MVILRRERWCILRSRRPASGISRPLKLIVRRPVEPLTELARVVQRMRKLGIDVEALTEAPWISELERRFKRQLPPLYRSLVLGYGFIACEVGEVELFGNLGATDDEDITVAPFRDPHISPWLIDHAYIQFGRPATGSYDPVCFDYSAEFRGSEPTIVSLDHEDILLGRRKVQKRAVAQSFAALMELPGA